MKVADSRTDIESVGCPCSSEVCESVRRTRGYRPWTVSAPTGSLKPWMSAVGASNGPVELMNADSQRLLAEKVRS
jgi:hypothetical protein